MDFTLVATTLNPQQIASSQPSMQTSSSSSTLESCLTVIVYLVVMETSIATIVSFSNTQ
jgi:hypothetical protein